jgi:hypothetical protein
MGKRSVVKGGRVEREIVKLHQAAGIKAERVPLSGAARYQGNGEDLDVYPFGADGPPLCCQVKALNGPRGTKGIIDALGDADALFLRFDAEPGHACRPPTVIVPWRTWERLLTGK